MSQINQKFKGKKLIIFDLDGTLTESKAPMDSKTMKLLRRLLEKKKVAVIGGGKYELFQSQFLKKLKASKAEFRNLFLFPVNSTLFYRFSGNGWRQVYALSLGKEERKRIMRAFGEAFKKNNYRYPQKLYGRVLEDRGSQITFSALGQMAPVKLKEAWNKTRDARPRLVKTLKKLLPNFEVRLGGLTSIDITRKGIDKAYGVRQIQKILGVPVRDMLFVGDALYPGGNDYAARKTGIEYIKVSWPRETDRLIRRLAE